jgi:thiol-disulfide isomerase/thioredoxin
MMTAYTKRITVTLAVFCFTAAVFGAAGQDAADPNIGREMPELKVSAWATDKVITQEELEGKPYVLEFWATWCGPCRVSIPHLNELYQRLGIFGVPIIGLSDETLDLVKPFAEQMGMMYYVGVSDDMSGLDFRGIPFAAVAGADGTVVWAGHPMDPAFEATLFDLAVQYKPEISAAIEAAHEGTLEEAYRLLSESNADGAAAIMAQIDANAAAAIENAQQYEGFEKYQALKAVADLYGGLESAQAAGQQLAELQADPEIQKAIVSEQVADELNTKMRAYYEEAMRIEQEESELAAGIYFTEKLIPVFEEFLAAHPDHELAVEIEQALPAVREQLEQLKAQQAEAEQQAEGDGDRQEQ